MRRGFKLSTLDADVVAQDATSEVLTTVAAASAGLAPVVTIADKGSDLVDTKLYTNVRRLCVYAQGGRRPADVERLVGRVRVWCGYDATSTTTKQKTPLQLVLTAVEAREAFEERKPLTSQQLAALLDLDRDHINGMAGRGEIPGAYRDDGPNLPWRFSSGMASFRRWYDARIASDREIALEAAP